MRHIVSRLKKGVFIKFGVVALLLATTVGVLPVRAADTDSLYSYSFDGNSAVVANQAAANGDVDLQLHGDWSPSAFGIYFSGNTTNKQSVGYGKPSGRPVIDVPANQAFGSAVKFKYQVPQSGCFNDSRNVTQIGRFGTGKGQIKLQISACNTDANQAFVQCRIAGNNSTSNDFPVTGTQALVDGETYVATCAKTPDPAYGSGTLELTTTRLDETSGNQVTTDTFSITRPGRITSWAYLSVANKYKLPSISNNTDQFVGDVAHVGYCQSTTLTTLYDCLEAEVPADQEPEPAPAPEPEPLNLIANASVETNLNGWEHYANNNVHFARSTDAAFGGDHSVKVYSAGAPGTWINGGFKDKPASVSSTTAGTSYTASVWVKPTFAGQTIILRVKEWNSSWSLQQDQKHKLVAQTTDWQQLHVPVTTTQTGGWLTYIVQGKSMQSGHTFYADAMRLAEE